MKKETSFSFNKWIPEERVLKQHFKMPKAHSTGLCVADALLPLSKNCICPYFLLRESFHPIWSERKHSRQGLLGNARNNVSRAPQFLYPALSALLPTSESERTRERALAPATPQATVTTPTSRDTL